MFPTCDGVRHWSRFAIHKAVPDPLGARAEDDDHPVEVLRISNDAEDSQRQRLSQLRAQRDGSLVEEKLTALRHAAEHDQNVIGPMLDCARAYCTLYEIRESLERVYGAYREPVFF